MATIQNAGSLSGYSVIFLAYEGDDLLGKYNTREEAEDALGAAREEAGGLARKRVYRVEARRRRGGE